ncbi:MAG: hypothetical protein DRG25_02705 [Deltaproteobacteria bacterium]|nr:MAG: hypothetical protein DRG25_02705 [Deltaproteobacteria bacterium]
MTSLLNIFRRRQRAKTIDREAFRRRFENYQEILNANREALELMAELQQKLAGDYLFDQNYLLDITSRLENYVQKIIRELNLLSDHRYEMLNKVLENVMGLIQKELVPTRPIPQCPFTIPFREIRKDKFMAVGEKCANLGEIRNVIGLPVPSGFAISTNAFQIFMQGNKLQEKINQILSRLNIKTLQELEEASEKIQALVMETPLPGKLVKAIIKSYQDLVKEEGVEPQVAVRSSGAREDSPMASFAGQYKSFLNVPAKDIEKCYKLVLSSQFSPRAIYYFKSRGFNYNDLPMAVGVMAMVQAKGAGIVYTKPPEDADKDYLVINAVLGLGVSAVRGETTPDVYHVSRKDTEKILFRGFGKQDVMTERLPGGGIRHREIPAKKGKQPVLKDDQISKLANMALRIENHFGSPQDIEWALDQRGEIFILQTRPLRFRFQTSRQKEEIQKKAKEKPPVLIEKGTIACKGIGAGPVHIVNSVDDLQNFPKGAVLVSHHAPPDYALVIDRASAIVTEVGSTASHLATVARELMVPALFNVPRATEILTPGLKITVDAINGYIYKGIANELINYHKESEPPSKKAPIYQALKNIAKHITPLNLTDPRGRNFTPEDCKTLHDITRFSHEMSMQEMFTLGERSSFPEGSAKKLRSHLPLDIYLIDLGNGIKEKKAQSKEVEPDDIKSLPFLALWQGITQIKWSGPRPVDFRGFMSVVAHSAFDPSMREKLTYKNYVIITDRYMNFSTRLGYHFSSIDAFISTNIDDNYVQFIFNGGGADLPRRIRRARLITKILDHYGFNTSLKEDNVYARGENLEAEVIEKMLNILGIVVVTTRQMDMAMYNDKVVEWYFKEFMKGNYSFGSTIQR